MEFLTRLTHTTISLILSTKSSNVCRYWRSVLNFSSNYGINLTIRGTSLQGYIKNLEKEYEVLKANNFVENHRLLELQPIIQILDERKKAVDNIRDLKELLTEKDDDIRKMAEEEKTSFEDNIRAVDERLLDAILPTNEDDDCQSIVLEVIAGVGGQEAMLFANELFNMYSNFAEHQGWEAQIAEYATTDIGGIRHGSLLISGARVFQYFKHEAGVHRVQRIPATEKAGRIHTSTASVVALPQPTEIQINVNSKDLKVETKRASGAGGQHVNTTDSAVRITHLPTGISVDCQVDRSQIKNRRIALMKLRALLYQKKMDDQNKKSQTMRKSQVRSNFRNEKIRTYNFPQDRISDHRVQGCNVHNLKGFLQGNEALKELIDKVDYNSRIETLLGFVNSINSK